MEPTDALRSIETALRLVIRDILGRDAWFKAKGVPDVEKLRERQDEERRRRDGVVLSDDLLNFTETYHLTEMIEKNWDQFKPVSMTEHARQLTSASSKTFATVLRTVAI